LCTEEKRRKDGVQRKENIRQRVKRETREELQPTIKSIGICTKKQIKRN
jgi:hypothetical protein